MVELYIKDKKLGTLNFDGSMFTYNSILENENFAKEQYFLTLTNYDLYNSINKQSMQIFPFFKNIINHIKKREDLVKLLEISTFDSEFEILTKLGKVRQNDMNFYVKTVE